tara:strand:- start:8046 stop:8204 length:159 start_codon:yes stop_codon:yes gene_type:complete
MTDAEIHERRKKNNLMLGGVLLAFVVLVFSITIAKMVDTSNSLAENSNLESK